MPDRGIVGSTETRLVSVEEVSMMNTKGVMSRKDLIYVKVALQPMECYSREDTIYGHLTGIGKN